MQFWAGSKSCEVPAVATGCPICYGISVCFLEPWIRSAAVSRNTSVIVDPKVSPCFFSLAKGMVLPSKCYFYRCFLCMIKWCTDLINDCIVCSIKIFFLGKLPLVFAQKILALYWPKPLSFVVRLALILQNDPSIYLIIKNLLLGYDVVRPQSYSWSSFRISVLNIFCSQ